MEQFDDIDTLARNPEHATYLFEEVVSPDKEDYLLIYSEEDDDEEIPF